MTLILRRDLPASVKPIHVLVVVVGEYLTMDNLPGAGAFAEELVHFWNGPREFPDGQALSTISVLASDPAGPVSMPDGSGGKLTVDRPTLRHCKATLLDWANTIAETEGVGVLHWIGHGRERALGDDIVSLFVDGARSNARRKQQGLDWTRSLWKINEITVGRPVYCFIDACRVDDGSSVSFDGLDDCDPAFRVGAVVFHSALPNGSAYWLTAPSQAVRDSGCDGQAVGTRAFMAALDGFGARYDFGSDRHPILAAEVVEGSSCLVQRWLSHHHKAVGGQKLEGGTTGPQGSHLREILSTTTPRSVVEVKRDAPAKSSMCHAESAAATTPSETRAAPFEFRLGRQPHRFTFDVGGPLGPKNIVYPSVQL